jgi:ubiquitin C-terminal hydrolase
LPRIMIISLKRFKSSKSKYGGMGFGGQKLDTLVEFPLEGLDMTPFVLCQEQKEHQLIYDLFAVSNHYGGVGGGHYTAFGQNPLNKQWYSFNDSSCQPAQTSRIVSEGAYNLFYRLREDKDLA